MAAHSLFAASELKRTALFFLIFPLIAASCKKTEKQPSPHVNTLSASVNSSAFVPSGVEVLYGGSSVQGTKQVNVYARRADGHELSLVMLNYNGTVRTYTYDPNPNHPSGFGCFRTLPGLINVSCGTGMVGEIRITSIDKNKYKDGDVVTGTFYFDADGPSGKFKVTNGQFSVFVQK